MVDHANANRAVWESASLKHVREYDELLEQARTEVLQGVEADVLTPLLADSPEVLHLLSGHGVDDHALVRAGARSVLGVDYSSVAVAAAQRRADELSVAVRYVEALVPPVPVPDASVDLVYTGKGALIWIDDLGSWAAEVARVLRPGGHLFIYEAHPMVPLWTWDADEPRIRPDRSYFDSEHVNDSFPADGAVERQRTLAEIVLATSGAGLRIDHLAEHPEPFWRDGDVQAAAWNGRLPNTFSLLARRV
jgi:SAM-dependent methyltransferase